MAGNNDKTKSVRCVRDIREFPPESYRLSGDGRKWMALCKERRAIANHLATYANGDGTSITAGINRWIREIGIKRRTLFRRLNDLRTLGLLRDKHGLTGESGTALRSLDVSKLRMPGEQGSGVPDSAAGVPDSTDQKCQIEQAGVPDSTAEVPDSRSGVPIPPVFGTQPSFLPSTNRPSNRTANNVAVVKDEKSEAVRRVWNYYIETLGKSPKLLTFTTARRKQGLARFDELLVKVRGDMAKAEIVMKLAVDALSKSPFHCGKNDHNRRFDSWEKNLFRSQEQMEEWLERT